MDTSTPQRAQLFPSMGPPFKRSRPGRWQWIDMPSTLSAAGKPTGIGLNFAPDPREKTLLIYFQAGGAAWDYPTSRMHIRGYGSVMHMRGFSRRHWHLSPMSLLHRRMWLFDRADVTNPWRHAHHVFLPYCTGDIYVGDAVRELKRPVGPSKRVYFKGQHNVREYLKHLVPTFPDIDRIYLIGSSAGGYGATFSWWLANEAWPHVQVDVISDAGHPILVPKKKYRHWLETWGPTLPDDEPGIQESLLEVLKVCERRFLGAGRYALIASRRDMVISAFLGTRTRRHADYIDELRETFFDDVEAHPNAVNARYFLMDRRGHTVFPGNNVKRTRIGHMELRRWLRQMVEEDRHWASWHEREGRAVRVVPGEG